MIFPAVDNDAALIDQYRPHTDGVQPYRSQGDTPGHDLMGVGGDSPSPLPSPTVGGENGSGYLNGFSTGFRSIAQRFARFTGAMIQPPAIQNPVQGQIGMTNRSASLYAGVMDQLTQYTPDQAAYVSAWVGPVPTRTIVTSR